MEYDLKTMYIVRGKLIMTMADLRKTGDDPEMLQLLWKSLHIIEKKIFDAELPSKIEEYGNILKR